MRAERGAPPILLLDEVAAHLDENRRAALFDLLCELGGQVWMTGTDESHFSAAGKRAQFWGVNHAEITEITGSYPRKNGAKMAVLLSLVNHCML